MSKSFRKRNSEKITKKSLKILNFLNLKEKKKTVTKKYIYAILLDSLFKEISFSSPVHPVSESRGGPLSVKDTHRTDGNPCD